MKKEKWMLSQIEAWEEEALIGAETAAVLKQRYSPKKSMHMLTVLLSIIGTLLIGMGVILIGAHNLWFRLPLAARAAIAFLPLAASQGFLLYVVKRKMHSLSYRESAALLNMAGVFATLAWIGQIFHLPSDFTNYIFVCGVLSLPSMLILRAASPLAIYYWTVINGGLFIGETVGVPVGVVMFAVGAAYAVSFFKEESQRSAFMAELTAIAGFVLLLVAALTASVDPSLLLFTYFSLLMLSAFLWEKAGQTLFGIGTFGFMVMMTFFIIVWFWQYEVECDSVPLLVLTVLLVVANVLCAVWRYRHGKMNAITALVIGALLLRGLWACLGLTGDAWAIGFLIFYNILFLALGVLFLWDGVKHVRLLSANAGILCIFTAIVVRFFDTEMSLAIRGVVFVILGIGFLLFNMYLVRMKKKAKEEAR